MGKYIGHGATIHRVHTTIGLTPFQVVYGKEPLSIPNYTAGTSNLEAIDSILLSRDELLTFLWEKLLQSQQKMKIQANCRRTNVDYDTGD